MSPTGPADRARVSTFVAVDPADAFDVFTQEIDAWWGRSRAYRRMGRRDDAVLRFEEGRLIEAVPEGPVQEIGRVLVWEPPARLVFEWRGANFAPGEVTEVEVRFEGANDGTRVTLEHRGWESLPAKHPVRHGVEGVAFTEQIGLWWASLATSFRTYVASRR